ncbi:carbohydrate ABC transporter permease [Erysipelothrix urinaevulpis]|uniref:carbohydrate ABC transporter permease n=1 Tax=Erysipelothrix urinaevulpis TaxID=2683717 RepID=UPI001357F502|nr:sugar ABC transporter permease [Erysipelothrix urinaevulpis]
MEEIKQTIETKKSPQELSIFQRVLRHFKKHSLIYLFLVPILIHFSVFYVWPIIFSFIITFTDYQIVGSPKFIAFDNWKRFFNDANAWRSIWNTFKFSLYYIVPTMALGLFFAVLIQSLKRKWATLFKGIFFLPVVTSFVVISGIWAWMFKGNSSGFINQLLSIFGIEEQLFLSSSTQALFVLAGLSVFKVVGNTMIYYYAGLQGIPDDVYEAAEIDGSGRFRTFFKITMPLLLPIHLYVAITTTIGSFQIFDSAYLLTNGGPNYATNTIVFYMYQQGFNAFNFGYASVLAYVLFFFIFIISMIQKRYLGKQVDYN